MPSEEHDEAVAMLRAVAAGRTGEPATMEERRANLDASGDFFPVPGGVEVEALEVEGIPCERYVPQSVTSSATLLYLHGGAYVAGSLRSHRALCARIARALGGPVIAVDYRLAPEHPHPAALEDATIVYRWLLATGHDPAHLVVGGDSAGGGLTLATLISLQGTDTPGPAGAVLISPWLDLTLSGSSVTAVASADPMLEADVLAADATAYGGDDLRSPLVSPLFATADQLAGLPPVLLLAGTADILVDDSRSFAGRAAEAGLPVDLDVEDGLVHVWPFIDGLPEANSALERIAGWVEAGPGSPPA